jgi:hypothetical protein
VNPPEPERSQLRERTAILLNLNLDRVFSRGTGAGNSVIRIHISILVGFLLLVLLATSAPAFADEPGGESGNVCPRFTPGSEGLPRAWEWRTHPALGDVNGDGHLDLAGHSRKARGPRVWQGDGRGGWTPASTGLAIPGMSCGVGVDLADVNGDGHLDLGVADHCHGLFVFLGNGDGSWRLAQGPIGAKGGYEDLQFGDLDGDGHLDLVAVGSFHGGIASFRGDGAGAFARLDMGLPRQGSGNDLALADLNGDGMLDVVAAFTGEVSADLPESDRHNLVWISDGLGGFRRASQGILPNRQYRAVAVGDLNGDARPDLAVSQLPYMELERRLHVYRAAEDGTWIDASEGLPDSPKSLSFGGVALVDLDRDGHGDLVATTWIDAGIRVWRGDGSGRWTECTDVGLPAGRTEMRGWGVDVGDVNGDGKPDLAAAFGRQGKGSIEVWLQQ